MDLVNLNSFKAAVDGSQLTPAHPGLFQFPIELSGIHQYAVVSTHLLIVGCFMWMHHSRLFLDILERIILFLNVCFLIKDKHTYEKHQQTKKKHHLNGASFQ